MLIRTPIQPLLNALSRTASVCTNPLKSNADDLTTGVLLYARDSRVCLRAFDNNTQIACSYELPAGDCVAGSHGVVVAPTFLTQLLRSLPGNSIVELKYEGDMMLHISTGTSKFSARVRYVEPDMFPGPEASDRAFLDVTLAAGTLKAMMESVTFCASKENFRDYLKTVRFKLDEDAFSVVALDGHRAGRAVTAPMAVQGDKGMFLLSIQAALLLQKLMPDGDTPVTLRLMKTRHDTGEADERIPLSGLLHIDMGDTSVISRLVTCKYPNVDGVWPSEERLNLSARLDRKELLSHIKSASLFSHKRFNSVGLSLSRSPDTLMVEAMDNDMGSGTALMDIQIDAMEGDCIDVALNADYIKDVLVACSDAQMCIRGCDVSNSGSGNIEFTPAPGGDKEPPFTVRYLISRIIV